ncbi:MAG: energy transducer TonB [Rhodocyclaceae bacterium]|nr:energy transducer TonB [Rhodocyclaceae bacterium]
MSASALYPTSAPALSGYGLAVVIAFHGIIFWGLLQTKMVALPTPLAVLTVSLLPPAAAIKPEPAIVPPPRPMERPRPIQSPIQLTAPAESPAPAMPPTPVTPPSVTAAPVAAAPVQTTPRFDADYLDNPKPAYPPLSRRLGEQGRVVLRVHVDADGRALDIQLHTSSDSSRLDQSAADTVRRWKFIPARHGQESVAAWVLVPIAFTLKD